MDRRDKTTANYSSALKSKNHQNKYQNPKDFPTLSSSFCLYSPIIQLWHTNTHTSVITSPTYLVIFLFNYFIRFWMMGFIIWLTKLWDIGEIWDEFFIFGQAEICLTCCASFGLRVVSAFGDLIINMLYSFLGMLKCKCRLGIWREQTRWKVEGKGVWMEEEMKSRSPREKGPL